jgi:hypothetical protein
LSLDDDLTSADYTLPETTSVGSQDPREGGTKAWGAKSQPRVDFQIGKPNQTSIRTNLKILLMGDSVGIQLSQTLEDAMGADPCARRVLRYSWGNEGSGHEGLHVSAPIQGSGAIAGWYRCTVLQMSSSIVQCHLDFQKYGRDCYCCR